jgi:hypothetical protein
MPKRSYDTRSTHHTQTKRTGRETKIIHQASSSTFPMAPLFLPLHLSGFSFLVPLRGQSSTFLLLRLIVVPVRMQTIARCIRVPNNSCPQKIQDYLERGYEIMTNHARTTFKITCGAISLVFTSRVSRAILFFF